MLWSKRVAEVIASKEAKLGTLEVWVLGTLSDLATAKFKELGWEVHAETRAELFPEQVKDKS